MKILITLLFIFLTFLGSAQSIDSTSNSKFLTDSIYSQYLHEYRNYNIYLPKNFDTNKTYPIIYATDGGTEITKVKVLLDSLIDYNIIEPIMFAASFANLKIADSTSWKTGNGNKIYLNYRNFEYVETSTKDSSLSKRFEEHMNYFTKEFIPFIETKYNQIKNKKNRYFYGVSNGAAFGMSLLNKHSDLISTYICLSTVGVHIKDENWDKNIKYPNLYIEYGNGERPAVMFKDKTKALKKIYNSTHSFIQVKVFKGGHNNKYWKNELGKILIQLFHI